MFDTTIVQFLNESILHLTLFEAGGGNIKANYRYNYILGNDHSFFYFNYPDLSPFYDI